MVFVHNRHPKPHVIAEDASYSPEQLLKAVNAYDSIFGNSVPLDLLTVAALSFRSTELMTALLDRIKKNDPVADWDEFKVIFLNQAH